MEGGAVQDVSVWDSTRPTPPWPVSRRCLAAAAWPPPPFCIGGFLAALATWFMALVLGLEPPFLLLTLELLWPCPGRLNAGQVVSELGD